MAYLLKMCVFTDAEHEKVNDYFKNAKISVTIVMFDAVPYTLCKLMTHTKHISPSHGGCRMKRCILRTIICLKHALQQAFFLVQNGCEKARVGNTFLSLSAKRTHVPPLSKRNSSNPAQLRIINTAAHMPKCAGPFAMRL